MALAPLLLRAQISHPDPLPRLRSDVPAQTESTSDNSDDLERSVLPPVSPEAMPSSAAPPRPHERPNYGANWIFGGVVAGLSVIATGTGFLIASGASGSSCANPTQAAACQARRDREQSQQTVTGAVLTAVGPWLLAGMVTYGAISAAGGMGTNSTGDDADRTDIVLAPALFLGGGGVSVQTRF